MLSQIKEPWINYCCSLSDSSGASNVAKLPELVRKP